MSLDWRPLAALCAAAIILGAPSAQPSQPPDEAAYRANNIGVARLEQFEHEAAAADFRRALEIDQRVAVAHLNLALALMHAGKLDEAREAAQAAQQRLPDLPHPSYVLGLIARSQNRMDEALAAFAAVRQRDPDDVGAAVNIGQIHLQEGRYPEALDALRAAVRVEPYNATAAYGLAMALLRGGAREEGAAAMQRFQQLRESGYATTFSQNYLEQGRYAEAVASTGAEPELVDARTPTARYRPEGDGAPGLPAGAAGVPTLVDVDGDGDLDLVTAHGTGTRLYRNDRGAFADVTAASGLAGAAGEGALPGDYDNDGLPDLVLLGGTGIALYRQEAAGRFRAVSAPGLEYSGPPGAAAWVDADHDGDLDLYVGGRSEDARARLLRNNGNGSFTDITEQAHLGLAGAVTSIVPTDYDNRRDIDLLVISRSGAPAMFRNLRDGTFRQAAGETNLSAAAPSGATAGAAGDVNKDGYIDFLFGTGAGSSLALSDGRGRFRTVPVASGLAAVRAAQLLDYDNDGLLDVVSVTASGLRVDRNLGSKWVDVSPQAIGGEPGEHREMATLAAGDIDGDGDIDLVTGGGRLTIWRNVDGGARSLRVRLTPRVSNRSSAGAKVEIRAGSLFQKLEAYAAWPSPAPADLIFGIGARPDADVVRVLWPAGILQAELPERDARTIVVEELDRKPSSCPYLYTWNGERFEFLTDFLGGGEMGYWLAPGLHNTPDPDEYVRIAGSQLAPRDGRFELRITNELEEALFLDRAQLLAIGHPAEVEVYPDEGIAAAPRPFSLHYAAAAAPPLAAVDDRGRDVLDRIIRIDRRYPDDLPVERIRGYAAPHALTLTIPPGHGRLLLLTGWTDYAFSGDNVAAHQAGLRLSPPSLQVHEHGAWRTAIENIGFPAGRPQTVVVDLAAVTPEVTQVRLSTSMRIYWDRIQVATRGPDEGTVTKLEPRGAELRWRGFSEPIADGRQPSIFDYDQVSPRSPWKLLPGRYTREGDVRELLTRIDDMFVIARPGDEIALSFEAALPPLPAGWTRTYLLYADGFSKEMDLNSASPDALAPLPFHGMSRYPYSAPEAYPSSPAHRTYLERYNTRIVPRTLPPLALEAVPPAGRVDSAGTGDAGRKPISGRRSAPDSRRGK